MGMRLMRTVYLGADIFTLPKMLHGGNLSLVCTHHSR